MTRTQRRYAETRGMQVRDSCVVASGCGKMPWGLENSEHPHSPWPPCIRSPAKRSTKSQAIAPWQTEIVADCYIVVHDEAAPIKVMVIDVPEMGPYQGQIKPFQHVDTGRTQQRPSALLYFG